MAGNPRVPRRGTPTPVRPGLGSQGKPRVGHAFKRSDKLVVKTTCLFLLVASVALVMPAGTALANSKCTFSDGVVRVTLDRPRGTADATLERDETGAIFYIDGSGRRPCGEATVLTTRRIKVEDVVKGGFTHFRLDISEGQFSFGDHEIPIRIDLGPSGYDTFMVYGGPANDFWTFGGARANLQRDSAAEIRFVNPPDVASGWSRGGADRICAGGGRGTGRASRVVWGLEAGARDDVLCGGGEEDHLLGADGDDVIRGRGASDVILGGTGDDLLFGNAGGDSLEGEEGSDEIRGGQGDDSFNGGRGPDVCDGGRGEIQRNCER